jgi:hypothetical protein
LLIDPLEYHSTQQPLVVWNTNGNDTSITSGIFGVFNLMGSGNWDPTILDYAVDEKNVNPIDNVTVSIHPGDIPIFATEDYRTTKFVALRFFHRSAMILHSPMDVIHMTLQNLESESVSMIPIHNISIGSNCERIELVVLGIRNKINGAGAIQQQRIVRHTNNVDGSNVITIIMTDVKGCGEFVLAFRSDQNHYVNYNDQYRTVTAAEMRPNVSVCINDRVLGPDHLHWNNKQRDAIDALQALDFDTLSFELLSVYGSNHRNTIEVKWHAC